MSWFERTRQMITGIDAEIAKKRAEHEEARGALLEATRKPDKQEALMVEELERIRALFRVSELFHKINEELLSKRAVVNQSGASYSPRFEGGVVRRRGNVALNEPATEGYFPPSPATLTQADILDCKNPNFYMRFRIRITRESLGFFEIEADLAQFFSAERRKEKFIRDMHVDYSLCSFSGRSNSDTWERTQQRDPQRPVHNRMPSDRLHSFLEEFACLGVYEAFKSIAFSRARL